MLFKQKVTSENEHNANTGKQRHLSATGGTFCRQNVRTTNQPANCKQVFVTMFTISLGVGKIKLSLYRLYCNLAWRSELHPVQLQQIGNLTMYELYTNVLQYLKMTSFITDYLINKYHLNGRNTRSLRRNCLLVAAKKVI